MDTLASALAQDSTAALTVRLRDSFTQLLQYVPALIGSLVILFAGYLLAKLLEKGTDRVLSRVGLNRWLERSSVGEAV